MVLIIPHDSLEVIIYRYEKVPYPIVVCMRDRQCVAVYKHEDATKGFFILFL